MTNTRPTFTALLAAAALALLGAPLPASAHDDATLDAMKSPHGGQLRMAGPYHLELVLSAAADGSRDEPVVVHVTDHAGSAEATAGAKGQVTLLSAGRKTVIELRPEGTNRMVGQGRYAGAAGVKAIVSVTLAGQPAYSARFTPGAGSGHGSMRH